MYETMIAALRQANAETDCRPKQLELANEMHKKELEEIKERHGEIVRSFERQLEELKNANCESEQRLKQLMAQQAESEETVRQKEAEFREKCRDFEQQVKHFEDEKKRIQEAIDIEAQLKDSLIAQALDKQKAEHLRELDGLKAQYERALVDIKYIHGQEKLALETRLDKVLQQLKLAEAQKDPNASMNMQEIQCTYLAEVQEINAHMEAFKKQSYEEIATLKKQRDEAVAKLASAERVVASRNLQKNAQATAIPVDKSLNPSTKGKVPKGGSKVSAEPAGPWQKELSKFKKENVDLKSYIAKLEGNERKLKALIADKDAELANSKSTHQQQLAAERHKAIQAYEECTRVQEEYNRKRLAFSPHKSDDLRRSLKLRKLTSTPSSPLRPG